MGLGQKGGGKVVSGRRAATWNEWMEAALLPGFSFFQNLPSDAMRSLCECTNYE